MEHQITQCDTESQVIKLVGRNHSMKNVHGALKMREERHTDVQMTNRQQKQKQKTTTILPKQETITTKRQR
jgi:hypothetical protein